MGSHWGLNPRPHASTLHYLCNYICIRTCVRQAASALRYLSEVKHWHIFNSFTFHASLRHVLSNETKTDAVSPLGGRSKVLQVL